jgi:hypothetical protein
VPYFKPGKELKDLINQAMDADETASTQNSKLETQN